MAEFRNYSDEEDNENNSNSAFNSMAQEYHKERAKCQPSFMMQDEQKQGVFLNIFAI